MSMRIYAWQGKKLFDAEFGGGREEGFNGTAKYAHTDEKSRTGKDERENRCAYTRESTIHTHICIRIRENETKKLTRIYAREKVKQERDLFDAEFGGGREKGFNKKVNVLQGGRAGAVKGFNGKVRRVTEGQKRDCFEAEFGRAGGRRVYGKISGFVTSRFRWNVSEGKDRCVDLNDRETGIGVWNYNVGDQRRRNDDATTTQRQRNDNEFQT
ncbi:hypothetical protein K435DRAFT_792351 [Dendrothele bispora CBS 962.96]|uniref:Uncharacterized protein n=1 Tax=Dendrothele bispora (strain CBS 962.96) TaxID=1314807 RepID=A0A4S8MJW7_DENBC|nr:hypothetical protein K435DRAFT_792351 [Dendrothele bispora CBS 962.96]